VHVTHRPAGTVTHHEPKVLHGVTRMVSGEQCSLFVLDAANGLGDENVLDLASREATGYALAALFCTLLLR